jgi:chromosome segregation ATPase
MAIDLVQGDSVRAELKQTQKILTVTQDKIKAQDTVIVSYEKKEIEHKAEVRVLEQKEKIYQDNIIELTKTNESLASKNRTLKNLSKWLGGGLAAALTIIVTAIAIK